MIRWAAIAALVAMPLPAAASTFSQVKKVCPVGGETFTATELMSISRWGGLPDGMPIGSGMFPVALTECPGNGLVMYRDFTPADVEKLKPLVADPAYQAMRRTETGYYRAWWLADRLGDDSAPWLLLSATWEAKNEEPGGERMRRYSQAFVDAVKKMPADGKALESIALRARAANALREIGKFDEAEALRASITIAPDAGAGSNDPEANRKGWTAYLAALGGAIARHDSSRVPIDLVGDRQAAQRCLEPERAKAAGAPVTPLSAFDAEYCRRPALAEMIGRLRAAMAPAPGAAKP